MGFSQAGRQVWQIAITAVVLAPSALVSCAQIGSAKPENPEAFVAPSQRSAAPSRVVPLLTQPLTLDDFAGMTPRAELRSKLSQVSGFIQNQPTDGDPATERTEVYFGYTHTTLYFVFLCFDRQLSQVRGHLARRENILNDDNVSVFLDTFEDRRRGVLFQINPAGVQADAAFTDANGADYSYDQVWDSDARMTDTGWMGLIAIPFRSLRFRENASDWGVVFRRELPRNSESDYWPRVATGISGTLSQEATLHGIEGVTGSHNLQLNPYGIAQNEHTLNSVDPNDPYWSTRKLEGTGGGEAKLIVKDSIVVDATINPDFSDVESDQAQFTVNQRYPVYFPELRPFFLENASYFTTPINLLYTRTIIKPQWGARVTGKLRNTNIGLLAIDDRQPGRTVPAGDPLSSRKAGFYVSRISQDLGKGSNVGTMYTDEEFGNGWNRVGGVDFTWRANDHWTLLGQTVQSSTHASDHHSAATIFPATYAAGPATDVQLTRSGHSFSLYSEYEDISTGFRDLVGFFQTSNIRLGHVHPTYQWYLHDSKVQSFGLELDQSIAFDHQGNRVYRYTTIDPFWSLTRKIVLAPIVGENSDTVGPQNGYALTHNQNFTENFAGLVAQGQPWSQFSFNINAVRGASVNYNPAAGQTPYLMHQENLRATFSINPLKQLTNDTTYLFDREYSARDGHFAYETQVFRTKLNYQFTRALSARVILQYDNTLPNAAETSIPRQKRVQAQALLTWLPHPGTVVYIGWNDDLQNFDHQFCSPLKGSGLCDASQPILPRGPGYLNDGRQLFIKASYLFRF